jgi:peptidoglycan/xylan/chitin deacetylase (PgdA/CDA1 family)
MSPVMGFAGFNDIARHRWVALLVVVAFVLAGAAADLTGHNAGYGFLAAHNPSARGLRALAPRVVSTPRRVAGPEERAVNRVRMRTPFVSSGGRRGRFVALTFDDGPGPDTWRVLRVLRRMHVHATFFQVGQMMSAWPRAARNVRRRGFPVGDHTLTHPPMASLTRREQSFEVLEQAARMQVYGDRFPRLFRPPYASFDRSTLAVVRRWRMLMVMWSVDSQDYKRPGVRFIVRNVVSRVRPGAIVLMHDAGGPRGQTVRALPFIVRRLRARGYRFVTVPRMMLDAPPGRRQKLPRGASRG